MAPSPPAGRSRDDPPVGTAVRYRYLAGLRRGWRSWAVLALVSGLAAGLALTAVADARRTTSALPRAMRGARAADAQVSGDATKGNGPAANEYADAVSRLPDVTAATRVAAFFMARITPDGGVDTGLLSGHALGFVRIADAGEPLNQARVVQGRPAAADQPEEITINRVLADTAGWRVGQVVEDVRLYAPAEMTPDLEPDPARGTPVRLRVVGLVEPIDDLLAGGESIPRAFLTPAFLHRHPDSLGYLMENVALRDGADGVDRFRREVAEVATAHDFQPMITSSRDGLRDARSLLRPQIVAIWLLGLVLLAVVALLAGQAIGRQVQLHEPDLPELRALGMTRSERRWLGVLHGLTVAVGAAAVAVVAAAVLSVVTPLGAARAYEWDRGFRLDVPALAIGTIVVVLLLTASSAVSAARVARRAEVVPGWASPSGGADRPSRAVELAAGAGAPPAFVVGMRMAAPAWPGSHCGAGPQRDDEHRARGGPRRGHRGLRRRPAAAGVDAAALRRGLGRRRRQLVRTHPGRGGVPRLGAARRRCHRGSRARLADDRRQGRAGLGRGPRAGHHLPHHRAGPAAAEHLRAGARAVHESTTRAPARRHGGRRCAHGPPADDGRGDRHLPAARRGALPGDVARRRGGHRRVRDGPERRGRSVQLRARPLRRGRRAGPRHRAAAGADGGERLLGRQLRPDRPAPPRARVVRPTAGHLGAGPARAGGASA